MTFNVRYRRDRRDKRNDYRKGRARPKLAIAGAISLAIGILLVHYVGVPTLYNEGNFDNVGLIGGFIGASSGVVMLLLSLSKRNQIRFVKGMDRVSEAFKDNCNCCKCTNCGKNHNHWAHDS